MGRWDINHSLLQHSNPRTGGANMRTRIFLLSASLIVVCVCWGQVNNASLTGLVTDPSGAVVVGAKVTLTNTATNVEQATTTTASGYYDFPVVQVGRYRLKVEHQNFQTGVSDVTLEVGEHGRQNVPLKIGSSLETVTVESAVPLLDTQDASPGEAVENKLINTAPLSARNWDDLLGLVPGVQADRYTEQGGGTAAGRTGGANVHGVRSLQNNFVLDGVDNNSFSENVQELTTQIIRPSVDAIQEFKIATNPYSAENGRSPGSLVTVTTKSGANALHGLAYEYLRNKVFDANDFFTNRVGRPRPKHVQNQFGGQIGGPVVKNKAFFFFNYEGTRIRRGRFYQANVPTVEERIGDFSLATATKYNIKADTVSSGCSSSSPCTGFLPMVDKVGDCVGAGNPFPGNQIPAGCIDPIAAKILALVPPPNFTPTSGALNIGNFINVRNLQDDSNNYIGRFDWSPTNSDTVWVRYTNVQRFRFVP